jgi:hypothetical protein
MSSRYSLQTLVLEKLGAPLVSAVGSVAVRDGVSVSENPKYEAEKTAELLAKAVQLSVSVANVMDLRETESGSDSIRLMLATLSGRLIALRYSYTGKIPADSEIQRLSTALEAALTFSDNFVPSDESRARLSTIEGSENFQDDNQIYIQYISALAPVITCITDFSFGRPEKKLVQEVSGRLVERASQCAKKISDNLESEAEKGATLSILRAFSEIYVHAHKAETDRLMAMDEQSKKQMVQSTGGTFSMEELWDNFERSVLLVESLRDVILPKSASASAPGPAPVSAPAVAEKNVVDDRQELQKPQVESGVNTVSEEKVAQNQNIQSAENKQGSNPMSFFKKTDREDSDESSAGTAG